MKKIGMYNAYLDTRGGGEKVFLAVAANLSAQNKVTIISHKKVDLTKLGDYFDLDLSRTKLEVISRKTKFYKIVERLPIVRSMKDLLAEHHLYKTLGKEKFDLFINNTYHSNLPNPGGKGVYMCMFPQKLERDKTNNLLKIIYRLFLYYMQRVFLYQLKPQSIDTYDLITANSKYTQTYIKKLWDKDSEILYPICDSMQSRDRKKEKIILNVGRFFDDDKVAHHKRQDFLLETFKQGNFAKDDWQLHFVGSVAETANTLSYVINLLKAAEGVPVYFHFNSPFSEVKNLYNKASIYWHATGYGSDPEKYPEKQEHFGISTVEAMSAGCIPIVIDRAGQKESVANGENGYLWDNSKQLINYTNEAINLNQKSRERIVGSAKQKSTEFNKSAFSKNLNRIFAGLI